MRYVYIVVRMMPEECPIPNLGVFSNQKAAWKRFSEVAFDRRGQGGKVIYNKCYGEKLHFGSVTILQEARIEYPSGKSERLRIERWSL